ncbi:hypothetical protein APY94_02890 [Thermococcus celericrescens]|uniref:Uncharacterized protein n=1 Tax=Thermococcus celericrescens TaxID=227598 RepID=A0A100XZ67_9EURY|nr:hypothetical protein [Thermococcus celericrescens]KUH34236.1 hypothetical protein APY94_02890 [Thermococcus celericrescens]
MKWKDWTRLPDVDDVRFKALRTLAFDEQAKDKDVNAIDIVYLLDIIQTFRTLAPARVMLFFLQRDNEWSTWDAISTYLQEKYGYAESTINGNIAQALRKLCEFDGDRLRLRPEVYSKAVEILENESVAREYAERFDRVVEEWLEAHGYYEDSDDEEDEGEVEDSEEEREDSEPSVELVLRNGSRVRIVLEVVVKNIRFEVV